jgi:hypothetical protein
MKNEKTMLTDATNTEREQAQSRDAKVRRVVRGTKRDQAPRPCTPAFL